MVIEKARNSLGKWLFVVLLVSAICEYAMMPAGHIVYGHPELKIKTGAERSAAERDNAVHRDGSFFYSYLLSPYTGRVQDAGRTVDESRSILMWRMVSYPIDSHLEVSVAAYLFNDVSGAIVLLGTLSATRIPMMVFDVISPAMLEQSDQPIASLGNATGHTVQHV